MAYKKETIQKLIKTAHALKSKYDTMNAGEIALCISNGNTKIGRVRNVSLMPILTCGNCANCAGLCYDVKACVRFTNTTLDARVRNWVLLLKDRDAFFERIEKALSPRVRRKYFRWHVAGDIIDADYFARMVAIAERHPDWTFWTYTKMYGIVNAYITERGALPRNLKVMFSEWDGVPMDNPYDMPVFAVRLKDGNVDRTDADFERMYKCAGNCEICIKANRGCIAGESTYNDEH